MPVKSLAGPGGNEGATRASRSSFLSSPFVKTTFVDSCPSTAHRCPRHALAVMAARHKTSTDLLIPT